MPVQGSNRSGRRLSLLDEMQKVAENESEAEEPLSLLEEMEKVAENQPEFDNQMSFVSGDPEEDDDCASVATSQGERSVSSGELMDGLGSEDDDLASALEREIDEHVSNLKHETMGESVSEFDLRTSLRPLDPLYEEPVEGGTIIFPSEAENESNSSSTLGGATAISDMTPPGYNPRSSIRSLRQSIHSNDSSIPSLGGIQEESDSDVSSRNRMRYAVNRRSIYDASNSSDSGPRSTTAPGSAGVSEADSPDSPGSVRLGSARRTIRALGSRANILRISRSTPRSSLSDPPLTGRGSGENRNVDIATAVDRLESNRNLFGQPNWNQTLAAAQIITATTNFPGSKRSTKLYGTGEHVLVLLNLLNHQNKLDDPMDFTLSPVNEFGYPDGAGPTEKQREGPFHYVICTVTVVHFDEDERYYTVRRGDTGGEQRADPNVMHPITDEDAIQAAFKAAKMTIRSGAKITKSEVHQQGTLHLPVAFYEKKFIPFYRQVRSRAKVELTQILVGAKCAFEFQFTGINLLVLCSFVYLFNEIVTLSFLPSSYDFGSAVLGLVVWIILFLELIFETAIRPKNYHELITSDKAYSPSTARHINAFHLCAEAGALLLFIPQFVCLNDHDECGSAIFFSGIYAANLAASAEKYSGRLVGRIILGLSFLKVFGLVRHWKQFWLNNSFEADRNRSQLIKRVLLLGVDDQKGKRIRIGRGKMGKDDDDDDDDESADEYKGAESSSSPRKVGEDQDLKNAANIGTALMTVNSRRILAVLLVITVVFPSLLAIRAGNDVDIEMNRLLAQNNLISSSTDMCDYLYWAVKDWIIAASLSSSTGGTVVKGERDYNNLIWAQLLPIRCKWQTTDGVITNCTMFDVSVNASSACGIWQNNPGPALASPDFFANNLSLREGALNSYETTYNATLLLSNNGSITNQTFYVKSIVNSTNIVQDTFRTLFLCQVVLLIGCLTALTVMRGDAGRLVLHPLKRMLKIVVRYAENPLSQSLSGEKKTPDGPGNAEDGGSRNNAENLGSYETDQLINAIAKIADLLRKCWGVAGAGIISSNLARTKDGKTVVFNPTVPGKRVYALFGFVAIREFDRLLRALDRAVMVLINDVARVVHDEVFRWSLNGSGQCNKNLGAAFLMVFRIGDFSEVHDRKKRATDVVFNSNSKSRDKGKVRRRRTSTDSGYSSRESSVGGSSRGSNNKRAYKKFEGTTGTLQLASLPGIQSFTDRALLGLLKSYAGLLRDEKLLRWKDDFRLGAGVGAFSVSVIYGMDAGWAVEGAVGSEYKIDATYLSPHVNMASRMMSAAKQYGVTILLSQAVEELLSKPARSKLRHLDTVIVKGASRPQRIFTYDARSEGTNFFLFDRPGDQKDIDAELYNPLVWDTDQDLKAMRQHVNEPFMKKFRKGVDLYISGEWKSAIKVLKEADNLMIETVIEEGYVEGDVSEYGDEIFDPNSNDEDIVRLRNQYGDGASKNLIQYMERRKANPPQDWRGFRALMSK